jgi:hypothetical protein
VSETDTVLPKVRDGLGRVELDGHALLCISYAYVQVIRFKAASVRWQSIKSHSNSQQGRAQNKSTTPLWYVLIRRKGIRSQPVDD